MNRFYNMLRPRPWRRYRRAVDGCLVVAVLCIAAYWADSARASEVLP